MSGYQFSKTLKKLGFSAVFVIIAGVASVYGDNPYYLAIAPALTAFGNYLKHKDDM